jgi:peptidyl-prolyl cis-trans isomerase B (cyclophilin B)
VASTRRDKELARQRAERQAARRAAAAHRAKQRRLVIASVLAVLVVAGGVTAVALQNRGGDDAAAPQETLAASPAAEPSASTAPSAAALPPGTCAYNETQQPAAKDVPLPPTEDVEIQAVYDVTLATDQGDIVFEADSAQAPCTINSFRSLAEVGYFDGTPCHRLTTQGIQVLQCGDPTGTGTGGPGYQFAEENLEGATYGRGTVAMAKSQQPGTSGSQFFLVYGDSPLPPDYTPFGKITKGLEVLDEVAKGGSNPPGDGAPVEPVSIESVTVEPQR